MNEPLPERRTREPILRASMEYLLLVCAMALLMGRWAEHGKAALSFARQWLRWIGL